MPRKFKEKILIGLKGVACITHPEFIREGYLVGSNVGMYEVLDPYGPIEVRNDEDFAMARLLYENRNVSDAGRVKSDAVRHEELRLHRDQRKESL